MGAHDGQRSDSAGEEEGTGDASGGEGADADAPTLTPHSIYLADTGSGTRLSALLTPPFNQLASPGLHAAAHAHHLQHAAQPDKPTTPPTAGDEPTSSTTRTTPPWWVSVVQHLEPHPSLFRLGWVRVRACWYARRDSNPHARRHQDLNLGRLPIPPLALCGAYSTDPGPG